MNSEKSGGRIHGVKWLNIVKQTQKSVCKFNVPYSLTLTVIPTFRIKKQSQYQKEKEDRTGIADRTKILRNQNINLKILV